MTREEMYEDYCKGYRHVTIKEEGLEFNTPAWKVAIMIGRILLFPVSFAIRVFRWTYHIE